MPKMSYSKKGGSRRAGRWSIHDQNNELAMNMIAFSPLVVLRAKARSDRWLHRFHGYVIVAVVQNNVSRPPIERRRCAGASKTAGIRDGLESHARTRRPNERASSPCVHVVDMRALAPDDLHAESRVANRKLSSPPESEGKKGVVVRVPGFNLHLSTHVVIVKTPFACMNESIVNMRPGESWPDKCAACWSRRGLASKVPPMPMPMPVAVASGCTVPAVRPAGPRIERTRTARWMRRSAAGGRWNLPMPCTGSLSSGGNGLVQVYVLLVVETTEFSGATAPRHRVILSVRNVYTSTYSYSPMRPPCPSCIRTILV